MARKIEIEVTGDTRSLERALSRAGKSTESSFKKMSRAAGVAGLAIAGGLAVAAKVGFDELSQMAKVSAQTEAVLKSTGGEANVTAKRVETLASSIAEYAAVDDEAVQSAENLLLTFRNIRNETGEGAKVFDNATRVTADLAQAMGMDLNSAALQVGKALNDPVKGFTRLSRIGVTFTKQQEKMIKKLAESGDVIGAQKIILEELNAEFGGSAAAFGETMPGKIKIAQESFKNLTGELMVGLLPAITKLTELGLRFSAFLQENPRLAKAMVIALAALATALLAASAAQMALNLAVLANPYVAAAAAIIALGAALIVLYQKSEFVRKHWQLLLLGFGLMPVVIATVVKAVVRHFDTLKAAFLSVKDFALRVFDAIANGFRRLLSPIFAVISAVQRLKDALGSIPSPGDFLPDTGGGVPFIPGIASGGDIARSGLAVVHRGERVVPARVVNRGAGSGGSFRGRYMILADGDFVSWLRGLDAGERRRNGGKGIL